MFILIASVHNFANDNSLSNIAETIDSLKQTLESECKVAIKWFHENKTIVYPDEFQAIILRWHASNLKFTWKWAPPTGNLWEFYIDLRSYF